MGEHDEQTEGQQASGTTNRRELLAKAAVVGGAAFAAPMILSSTASATVSSCGGSPPPCKKYRNKYHDNSGSGYDAETYGYWLDGNNYDAAPSRITHNTGSGTTSTITFTDRVKWTRYAIFYGDSWNGNALYRTKVPGYEFTNSSYGTCDGNKSGILTINWPADRQSKDYVLVIEFTLAPYCKKSSEKVCKKYDRRGRCTEYQWVDTYSWEF